MGHKEILNHSASDLTVAVSGLDSVGTIQVVYSL